VQEVKPTGTVNFKLKIMTRVEILKANGIEMIISNDRKKRLLKNDVVAKEFPYNYNIKIDELENLFGEIEHSEYW